LLIGIEGGGGFVQNQDLGVGENGQREPQPLAVALGQFPDVLGDHVAQGAHVDDLPQAGVDAPGGDFPQAGEKFQGLPHAQGFVERVAFRQVAHAAARFQGVRQDVHARERDAAGGGRQITRQDAQGRALSRAVGAEQAHHLTGADGEGHSRDGARRVVILDEALNVDHGEGILEHAQGARKLSVHSAQRRRNRASEPSLITVR
jgi:hypothetical protein